MKKLFHCKNLIIIIRYTYIHLKQYIHTYIHEAINILKNIKKKIIKKKIKKLKIILFNFLPEI